MNHVRAASPLSQGSAVDRYTIEALIGRGGMGEVYRAVDTKLRRKVALKVLRMDERRPDGDRRADGETHPDGVARLFREARAAAALTHPNTVAIHDLGESDTGLFYIVMELVNGQPLLAYVGDERVSLARRLKWLTEIARALATAHKAGVIHRDVKPSNVMISDEDVAKVLDFGLAKPMPKAGEPESFGFKTQAGRVLGTLRYMAPEQMIGSDADGRSDQYSLGMTAYELIAGRYPPGKAFDVPPLLNTIVAGFPADGALAIARMLKRIPEDRFGSMEDVASAFEDLAAGRPVRALGEPVGPKPARKAVVIEDKTVLDPPQKHGPETLPEKPIGSTLTSAEDATLFHGSGAPKDELSVDTVNAAEDALQPTVSPTDLALARTMLPNEPGAKEPTVPPTEAAPSHDDSGPVSSNPAASRTLQSADAGDRVRDIREATAKQMAEEEADKNERPVSRPAAVATTLASGKPSDLVLELRKAAEGEPKPKSAPAGSTLASQGPSEAVMAVRAATAKPKAPPRVESVPPPRKEKEDAKEKDKDKGKEPAAVAKKSSNLVWIVLTIAFLALAAFAGNYFGARSRKSE